MSSPPSPRAHRLLSPAPSFHGHAGEAMPEHPLPPAGDRGDRMGRGCSDRHHGNAGSRDKCQGSQPGLHRLCDTSVSLVASLGSTQEKVGSLVQTKPHGFNNYGC